MQNLSARIIFLISAIMLFSFGAAISADREMMQKVDELMKAQKWMEAAALLQDITNADNNDGEAWFKQGMALHSAGNYKNAIEAYHQADRIGYAPIFTRYNLACSYALSGQNEQAVQALAMSNCSKPTAIWPLSVRMKNSPRYWLSPTATAVPANMIPSVASWISGWVNGMFIRPPGRKSVKTKSRKF